MKYILNVSFTDEERRLLEKTGCKIIPEINLNGADFADGEIPQRMIKHGRQYIAEIIDDETGKPVWGRLSKWRGVWHYETIYESLESMMQGL